MKDERFRPSCPTGKHLKTHTAHLNKCVWQFFSEGLKTQDRMTYSGMLGAFTQCHRALAGYVAN